MGLPKQEFEPGRVGPLDGVRPPLRRRAPTVGEHNAELLRG
jgi:hypothetical protein